MDRRPGWRIRFGWIVLAVIAGAAVLFIGLTYPDYRREMRAQKAGLTSGSTILKTDHGDLEYVV